MSRFWKELSCEPADIVDADLCLMDAQADVRVFGFMKLSSGLVGALYGVAGHLGSLSLEVLLARNEPGT